MSLSLQDLRDMAKDLKNSSRPALKVETQTQADYMTSVDPVGHKWCVGEEYYIVYAPTGMCEY